MTECTEHPLRFQSLGKKKVEGNFDGKKLSSDGGALLLREVCEQHEFFERLSECFTDYRAPILTTHSVESLLKQRIYGLACGYEDLSDHDAVRNDAVFQLLIGNNPETDTALASHSTLNRLELTGATSSPEARYKKIVCNQEKIEDFMLSMFIEHAKREQLSELILDLDATDIPLHGNQEDRHYHGYYGHHCYLPLYIFCDEFPLYALLRPSNIDASLGTEDALNKIIPKLQQSLPGVRIIIRADSGFCRESIMSCCKAHGIEYVIGLARNNRLQEALSDEMAQAKEIYERTQEAARVFKDFSYQTLDSWSESRRVIGKAEYLSKGENPRFVVTSLNGEEIKAKNLYEVLYCQRGNAENRLKEQFHLFAGRTSCQTKRANQIRLLYSVLSYLIIVLLRNTRLKGTDMQGAYAETIRVKLLKVAVQVKVSCRRIYLSFAESCPYKEIFAHALAP